MPSGPPELHEFWTNHGPSSGDFNAVAYLKERGWRQTNRWEWIKPSPDHLTTDTEGEAIDYLILEWDWGGIVDD